MAWPGQLCRPPAPEKLEQAALLCAADTLTDAQIAAQLGIARRTLARWKRQPRFRTVFEPAFDARCRANYAVWKAQRDADHAAKMAALRPAMQERGRALAALQRERRRW